MSVEGYSRCAAEVNIPFDYEVEVVNSPWGKYPVRRQVLRPDQRCRAKAYPGHRFCARHRRENADPVLTPREMLVVLWRNADVLHRIHGDKNRKRLSLQQCAERLQVGRERVRQIEAKAYRQLRHRSILPIKEKNER